MIYYADEHATLWHGRSPDDIDQIGEFDLVVTSPPYNLGNTTGGGFGKKSMSADDFADGYETHDDNMPHDEYIAWQCATLRACWERLPEHGAIFYNVKARVQAGTLIHPVRWVPPEMNLRQVVVWDKNVAVNFSEWFYAPSHELVLIFAKPGWRLADRSSGTDVWRIAPGGADKRHPCPFPDALARRAISTSANVSRVFDPFAGSGTTLAVAKGLDVCSVGIELSETYCEIAKERLVKVNPEPSLFQ